MPMKLTQTYSETTAWKKEANHQEYFQSRRHALITGPVEVIFSVLRIRGLKQLDDGSMVKEYNRKEQKELVMAQLTVSDADYQDDRFVEKPARSIQEDFPVGTSVFFLGGKFYGCGAQVVDHKDEMMTIRLALPDAHAKSAEEPTFGTVIASEYGMLQKYYPSHVVNKLVGISGLTLSRLTANLKYSYGSEKLNLGLNLKFEAKGLKVAGYSKKGASGWEFSEKAVELISEYKRRFPEFIDAYERTARSDEMNLDDIFHGIDISDRVQELKEWLKSIGNLNTVPIDVDVLGKEAIKKIEETSFDWASRLAAKGYKNITVEKIPRNALLIPDDAPSKLSHQTFSLGDRVEYVLISGSVPPAYKGTVVGIAGQKIDVVFDLQFMSGGNLGGRYV